MTDKYFHYNIIILGESSVGKTSLIQRYTNDTFSESLMSTIGLDMQKKVVKIDEDSISIKIWDTAGQEKFKSVTNNYMKSAHGAIFVYDITNMISFNNLKYWINNAQENTNENLIKILVGNKSDLQSNRQVKLEEANNYANSLGITNYEASAKNNNNVELIFNDIIKKIHFINRDKIIENNEINENLHAVKKSKKKCC